MKIKLKSIQEAKQHAAETKTKSNHIHRVTRESQDEVVRYGRTKRHPKLSLDIESKQSLKESTEYIKDFINATVQKIAIQVRNEMVDKYGTDTDLSGHCIEASDRIVELLESQDIKSEAIEGWCMYDDEYYGSDRPYDEHTWVELSDGTYIDVTADQFNVAMYEENKLGSIIIGKMPDCMVYTEPKLDDEGFIIR